MIVTLIEKIYSFLWGNLVQIPLPGGSSLGISLLIILLIPTGIYFTIRTRFLPIRLDNIHVFDNLIRVDSTIEWSQDNSIPVVEYKKSSRSAKEYTELAREVMDYVSR